MRDADAIARLLSIFHGKGPSQHMVQDLLLCFCNKYPRWEGGSGKISVAISDIQPQRFTVTLPHRGRVRGHMAGGLI